MKKNMSKAILDWHEKRGFIPRSEETKRKISIGNMGRKISISARNAFEARNNAMAKQILCITNGITYKSKAEACRLLNLNAGHMSYYFHGKCSHIKGFTFKILEKRNSEIV